MPLIGTIGAASARGFGLIGASPSPVILYTSRNTNITEGLTSNFLNNAGLCISPSWGYGGNSTDAIWITTTGATAKLAGFTMCNYYSGTNSFSFTMYVIAGNATNGTVLASKSFSGRSFNTTVSGQTMIEFDTPVTLPPGSYTLAFAWTVSLGGTTYKQTSGYQRSTSSITGTGGTLNITYYPSGNPVTFNGTGALGASNGTDPSNSYQGQVVTLKWLL